MRLTETVSVTDLTVNQSRGYPMLNELNTDKLSSGRMTCGTLFDARYSVGRVCLRCIIDTSHALVANRREALDDCILLNGI